VTAAMPDGTGLAKVMSKFPDRTLDTGICEGHATDMCAGMAKSGVKPFFAVYSTFVQRALDQVFQEIALQGHAVRFCLDRAGYVGGDGAVHHGFMDVSLFRALPGVVQLAASDETNLRAGMEFMRTYDDGASVIRYPRDKVPEQELQTDVPPFELGKANLIKPSEGDKPDLAILAYGVMVYNAHEALAELKQQGYDVALYDARFAMPVDADLVQRLVEAGTPILTVEDHSTIGGLGTSVLEACNELGLNTQYVYRLGMPNGGVYKNSRGKQLAEVGLDAPGIARRVREILGAKGGHESPQVHVTTNRTGAMS